MNKIHCTSQNMEAKTLPADICILGRFGWLSPAAVHSADYQFVSSIVTYLCKTPFCCVKTVANNALNRRDVFDQLWVKHDTHFEHSFLIKKCPCKMVTTLLLISSTLQLSHATSIYDRPK